MPVEDKLTVKAGVNRFAWNMRYPDASMSDFPPTDQTNAVKNEVTAKFMSSFPN